MSSLRAKFGKQLRRIRKRRDLTQEQLAEIVDVSPEFISNVERGINAPSFETLEKLAEALRVAIKDFFDYDHET
ncbi:MAG: helix-turn-helix transcriptional regulator [Anaerolineae bacterium]|nr:helix-turn-helix transcriptional regulator [Anaerolineae bacterium]